MYQKPTTFLRKSIVKETQCLPPPPKKTHLVTLECALEELLVEQEADGKISHPQDVVTIGK